MTMGASTIARGLKTKITFTYETIQLWS